MSRKRIIIDARHLDTSTGVYMQNLLRQLDKITPPDIDLIALVPQKELSGWSKKLGKITLQAADQKWYSISEQFRLAWQIYKLKPSLVHFCMPQQPLLFFGKRVTTIHDLTLVRFNNIDIHPLVYKVRKAIFSLLLRNVIWRSRGIVTPTDYVRQDLLRYTSPVYAPKILVTRESGAHLTSRPIRIDKLQSKRFLFCIGNAFPYKNLDRIVDAYKVILKNHPDLQLVFAGRRDSFYQEFERRTKDKGVNICSLGFVDEAEKRWLFQNAASYVVASLSEGFHIPGLEAMHEGCPVVSSDATCLPEVYGQAAHYFNPEDTEDMAEKINEVLSSEKLRRLLISNGHKQLKKYSWEKMARETMDIYQKVLNGGI